MAPSDTETDTQSTRSADTEHSWSELLAAYRVEPNERWSGALTERLGPWLTRARRRLIAVPPYLDQEDVAQQLVLEVLRIAARWRPQCEECWIPRKLVEAAERRVRKALVRERSVSAFALDDQLPAAQTAEADAVLETPIGRASAEDLRVIYRVKVLGEPITALAREAGVTPRQMRHRVWAARQRARAAADGGVEQA